MSTIMTSPPPPRAHEGDSDLDMDEVLRRIKEQEKRSELPQLPLVPGLHVGRHVRGVVARMTASAVTLGAECELVGKQIRCHIEKGCTCGPNDECRHPHPVPPQTALPLYAGLIEDLEREDDERGYEEEPEAAVFAAQVRAAIEALAAGVLPTCQQCWCGHQMTSTGGDGWLCAFCGSEWTGPSGAVSVPSPEAADIGSGFCAMCGQPVSTLDGNYTCGACGHNN